jgi:hypothetical protein
MASDVGDAERAPIATWSRMAGWFGVAGHVLVGGVLTLVSPLVAPMAGVAVIGMAMVALLVIGLQVVGRHRWALLGLPLAAYLVWNGILAIGGALYGWAP